MIEFTKEEISLCKQVAEKHGREIKCGDWVVIDFPRLKETVTLFDTKWSDENTLGLYNYSTDEFYKKWFPLWTISDCLEFLRERGSEIELWQSERNSLWFFRLRDYKKAKRWWKGNTPLEACLKAVLAVLEDKN